MPQPRVRVRGGRVLRAAAWMADVLVALLAGGLARRRFDDPVPRFAVRRGQVARVERDGLMGEAQQPRSHVREDATATSLARRFRSLPPTRTGTVQ